MPELKLATYNIHRCIGSDGIFDPERIIDVVAQLDADIVALQEVETKRDGGLDLLARLSQRTGMQAIDGPTIRRTDAHYGNAVLTRRPFDTVERIDISMARREPRGAISCLTRMGKHRIHLIATHLGLRPTERHSQVSRLLQELERQESDVSILMGDLNEWLVWGRTLRRLRRHFTLGASRATFPSRLPLLALDRIWIDPPEYVRRDTTCTLPLARKASDHLPLSVVVEL